jgi:hypothetical protein
VWVLKDTIKLKIKIDKGANKHQFQKSNPLVSSLPRKASAPIRQAIIDALKGFFPFSCGLGLRSG